MTHKITLFVCVVFIFLASGCSAPTPLEPTATQEIPTSTSTSTPRLMVTATMMPTETLTSTVTPSRTATLTPTNTPTSTATPTKLYGGRSTIVITGVSARGNKNGIVMGMVYNADPATHAVAVFIYVEGGWWVKPYWNSGGYSSQTDILPDGSWSCNIVTGGHDEDATAVAVFLIQRGLKIPQGQGGPLPWSCKPFLCVLVERP